MPEDLPRSKSGAPIVIHEPRMLGRDVVHGESETVEQVGRHIEKHVGKVDQVYHEIVSPIVHIDVHLVKPTAERPFNTLVTSGMSERPMALPEGVRGHRYAELMLCLPAEWPLTMESFKKEDNYWPIGLLKMLARMPHECDTWLDLGHTVPNGDPPKRYASNTELCCALLLVPLMFDKGFATFEAGPGKKVTVLSVVPIYREEMQRKLDRGTESLIAGFEKERVTELLDVRRRNTCRRKFLGLF